MAVNKIKITKAVGALIKAGMSPATARNVVKLLDLDKAVGPQIADLVEEDPELFGLDENGEPLPDEEDTEDDTPMTAAEAKAARLRGVHRLTPSRSNGETSAQRLAAALGAGRARPERPTAAPATAQAAASRLRAGIGNGADR